MSDPEPHHHWVRDGRRATHFGFRDIEEGRVRICEAPCPDDLLPSAFWGAGGQYVVLHDPMDVYGPFHSDEVAHVWSKDMGFHPSQTLVLTIKPPPKAPRHRSPSVGSTSFGVRNGPNDGL